MSSWRGLTVNRVATALLMAAFLAIPASAQGELKIKYERLSGTVSQNSQSSVTAVCPPNYEIAGGGADAGGVYGGVGLNSTYPAGTGGWTTFYDSHGGTVLIRSYAICVRDPATINQKTYPNGGTQRVRCPNGTLTGGGIYSSGTFDQSAIRQLAVYRYPNRGPGPPNRWQVNADNISNPVVNIDFTGYSVCHQGLDLSYHRAKKLAPKGKRTMIEVHCNANQRVLGGGGLAASLEIWLEESYPIDTNADEDKLPDNGWHATLDNTDTQRELTGVHAVCVKP